VRQGCRRPDRTGEVRHRAGARRRLDGAGAPGRGGVLPGGRRGTWI